MSRHGPLPRVLSGSKVLWRLVSGAGPKLLLRAMLGYKVLLKLEAVVKSMASVSMKIIGAILY